MNDFDKRFEQFDRDFKKAQRVSCVSVLVWLLILAAFWGTVIYVVLHFLAKVW